jgi:hypothetical protein
VGDQFDVNYLMLEVHFMGEKERNNYNHDGIATKLGVISHGTTLR